MKTCILLFIYDNEKLYYCLIQIKIFFLMNGQAFSSYNILPSSEHKPITLEALISVTHTYHGKLFIF